MLGSNVWLPNEVVVHLLTYLGVEDVWNVGTVDPKLSEEIWERLVVWLVAMPRGVRQEATADQPAASGRRQSRRRRSQRTTGRSEFGRLCGLRRSNAEEALARYDAASVRGLRYLRKLLIDLWPVDVNHAGSVGETLLHAVVADVHLTKTQTLQCAKELMDIWGADPCKANDRDFAPLMSAAALGDHKVVRCLLENGADPDARGSHPNGFVGAPVRPGQRPRNAREWAEAYGHQQVVDLIDRYRRKQSKQALAHDKHRSRTSSSSPRKKATKASSTSQTTPLRRRSLPLTSEAQQQQQQQQHHHPSSTTEVDAPGQSSTVHEEAPTPVVKRQRRSSKTTRYCLPDCQCDGANVGEMVACDKCNNWFHIVCLGIDLADFKDLVRNDDDYICAQCHKKDADAARKAATDAAVALQRPPPPPPPVLESSSSDNGGPLHEPLGPNLLDLSPLLPFPFPYYPPGGLVTPSAVPFRFDQPNALPPASSGPFHPFSFDRQILDHNAK